jgi:HPt (histidine-containing phosphotransfer) domain-containing protein
MLKPMDRHFWSASDASLVQEFSHSMVSRLPQMRADLLALIHRVQAAISALPARPCTPEMLQEVHAIKSSALALGYMRLAALIANLEYRLTSRQTDIGARNIAAIAECLKDLVLE